MNHPLYFENPEEILEFIKYQGKQIFKFRKEWEFFVTEHTLIDDTIIILPWKGQNDIVHSKEELFLLLEDGKISLIKEKIRIKYSPFKKIKKLTKSEYKIVEGNEQKEFDFFEQIISDIKNQKNFEEYLREKEEDKK
jgi:hypothetical protein